MSSRFRFPFAFAVLLIGFMPSSYAQSSRPANRLVRPPSTNKLAQVVPLGKRPMTVVLKMAGDPVAVVRS
jgi:hypothetical protein